MEHGTKDRAPGQRFAAHGDEPLSFGKAAKTQYSGWVTAGEPGSLAFERMGESQEQLRENADR